MVDGTVETIFYTDRQVNDYGGATGNVWSAAAYGAACQSLYTKLRAAYPAIKVYQQSAIIRTTPAEGTPNVNGNSLAQYRAAGIAAVAAANAAAGATFCFNLDGTVPTIALADGMHPSTAGHAAYSSYAVSNWFTF